MRLDCNKRMKRTATSLCVIAGVLAVLGVYIFATRNASSWRVLTQTEFCNDSIQIVADNNPDYVWRALGWRLKHHPERVESGFLGCIEVERDLDELSVEIFIDSDYCVAYDSRTLTLLGTFCCDRGYIRRLEPLCEESTRIIETLCKRKRIHKLDWLVR